MCRRDEKDGTQTRVCAKGPGDSCWAIVLGNRAPEGFSFATVCVVCYLARVRVFVCVHVCVLVFMFLCMCVVLSCSHPSWGSQQRRPDPSLRSKVRICCTPASGVRIAGPFADDPTVSRVSSPPHPALPHSAMPLAKRSKESDAQKAARLQRQSVHLSLKADKATIIGIMNAFPEVTRQLKSHLSALGYIDAAGSPVTRAPANEVKVEPPAEKGEAEQEAKEEEDADSDIAATASAAASALAGRSGDYTGMKLHRNYATWGLLPPCYMKILLGAAEPCALSPHALKAITSKGCKEPRKIDLLQLWERLTDFAPDAPVGEEKDLEKLCEWVAAINSANQRPLRDVMLPPDYSVCGVYTLSRGPTGMCVNFAGGGVIQAPTPEEVDHNKVSYTIEKNFSKLRAEIVVMIPSGDKQVEVMRENVAQLFAVQGVAVMSGPPLSNNARKRAVSHGAPSDDQASATEGASPAPKLPRCSLSRVCLSPAAAAALAELKTENEIASIAKDEIMSPAPKATGVQDASAVEAKVEEPPDADDSNFAPPVPSG